MTEDGPILVDFGVVYDQHDEELTTGDKFLGTIGYAAPEYLFAKEYDATIDTFSFGSILYYLAVGWPRLNPELSRSEKVFLQGLWNNQYDRRLEHILLHRHGFRDGTFLHGLIRRCLRTSPDVMHGMWESEAPERPSMADILNLLRTRPGEREVPAFMHHTNYTVKRGELRNIEDYDDLFDAELDRLVEEKATSTQREVADVPIGGILVEAALVGGSWPVKDITLVGLVIPEVTQGGAQVGPAIEELVSLGLLESIEWERDGMEGTSYYLTPLGWRLVLDGHCDEVLASVDPDEARKAFWESLSEP